MAFNSQSLFRPWFYYLIAALVLVTLAACTSPAPRQISAGSQSIDAGQVRPLKAVATTTIIGDVVDQIGGGRVQVEVLMPVGSDPHGFEPSPQDVAKAADADIIFASGAGLEEFLEPFIENAGGDAQVVHISEGIDLLEPVQHQPGNDAGEHDEEAEEHLGDPHVWLNPSNVAIWAENIAAALQEVDPANAAFYQTNLETYKQELQALDTWIREQVDGIPVSRRRLVTDHQVFAYFADAYGFEQVGTVIPGYSTMSQPSAQELAKLEDDIRGLGVPAILVGNTVSPNLAQRVAEDTGIQLVYVYTDSLTEAGGEAESYLDYMRYNVSAIAGALK